MWKGELAFYFPRRAQTSLEGLLPERKLSNMNAQQCQSPKSDDAKPQTNHHISRQGGVLQPFFATLNSLVALAATNICNVVPDLCPTDEDVISGPCTNLSFDKKSRDSLNFESFNGEDG